ncbi:MAG: 4-(cytidine 5'-diphospho)-2-C-methyl-D-erythritol kinase, partial [Desulfobacterales bacterium]|nr:4-(cytidine 5'-diphospho)-2-C-methyl-D-erythritol kinase [Desulfobacterales bacterium]
MLKSNSYLLSPAKINLFLQITRKRQDGYHNIRSLMCCISLYDRIKINFETEKILVSCSDATIPSNEGNTAYKAAKLFFETLDKKDGIEIFIEKNIPVGAGLGGGSSNAGTVLCALNEHYNFPISKKELIKIACMVGADVPFFIQ